MKNENFEHCKAIAMELENIVNDHYKNVDGMPVKVETDSNGYDYLIDDDNNVYCEAGSDYETDDSIDIDTLDDFTIYDYFNDVYDIEWTLDSNFNYKGVRLMVACGGPNIYVDTMTRNVELYWWSDSAKYSLNMDVVNAIDEYFEEYLNAAGTKPAA